MTNSLRKSLVITLKDFKFRCVGRSSAFPYKTSLVGSVCILVNTLVNCKFILHCYDCILSLKQRLTRRENSTCIIVQRNIKDRYYNNISGVDKHWYRQTILIYVLPLLMDETPLYSKTPALVDAPRPGAEALLPCWTDRKASKLSSAASNISKYNINYIIWEHSAKPPNVKQPKLEHKS